MTQVISSSDPLSSPHPVPWNWVLSTHRTVSQNEGSGLRYYQTPPLGSPDGEYRAYARIVLRVEPQLYRSRVSSQLLVENCRTGNEQQLYATSPMALATVAGSDESELDGTIALSMPLSWSKNGDRLLVRHFEGLFCASEATDYALIWDRRQRHPLTLAPNRIHHTHAVLLGWSEAHPNQILFRVGCLGKSDWHTCSVNLSGVTMNAENDRAVVFGKAISG
jgi:hypothetical protein